MINLLGNEIYKLFHKKGIYILLAIVIFLTVLVRILAYSDLFAGSIDDRITMLESNVKSYETVDTVKDDYYIEYKTELDILKIQKEKNLKEESPELYFLNNNIKTTMMSYYRELYLSNDEVSRTQYKTMLDEQMKFLDNFDWKKIIEDEIKTEEEWVKNQDKDSLEQKVGLEKITVLKYRLDNNIPYSDSAASMELSMYPGFYEDYLKQKDADESKMKQSDKYDRQQNIKTVEETKYKMEHKYIQDGYKSDNAQEEFTYRFKSIDLFVVICIVLISGGIVSDEFSKGTIKQLLVRPYSRVKIILSKMIASFIVVLLFMLVLAITETVICGIQTGTFNTLLNPIVVYDFYSNKVIELNTITMSLLNLLYVLPNIFIINLGVFVIAVISTNTSVSTVFGILLYVSEGMFTIVADKAKAISFLPQMNWWLVNYQFGAVSENANYYLSKALVIDSLTVLILFVLTLVLFNKKDIKNQ